MRSLIDLKQSLIKGELEHLYVFTGEENLIRRIYYQKIGEIYGNLKFIEDVGNLYKELEKKPLFSIKTAYVVYNDLDFLKQKEKVYNRLLKLIGNNIVILVYDDINEKSDFYKVLEPYITVFNKVAPDIAVKYVNKLSCGKIGPELCNKIAYNCNYSYNNIVEEINKYNWFVKQEELDAEINGQENYKDHAIDALTYAMIFIDRKEIPTAKEFANAFVLRNQKQLAEYLKIIKDNSLSILAYLPELYSTISILLFLKVYGKWNGGSAAYNAGEYWGRIKELRDFNIIYSKDDLLDIRYLVNDLDIKVRSGQMKAEHAWEWLIGVVL